MPKPSKRHNSIEGEFFYLLQEQTLKPKGDFLSIGDAAKKAGISRQSLQYYIMLGLVEPSKVTPTARRLFDQKAIEKIRLIKKLNNSGYPLRAIRVLFLHRRNKLKGIKSE